MTSIQASPTLAPKANDTVPSDAIQRQAQLMNAARGSRNAAVQLPPQVERQVLSLKSLEQLLATFARFSPALANQVPPPRSMLVPPTQLASMSTADVSKLLASIAAARAEVQTQVPAQESERMNSIVSSMRDDGLATVSAGGQRSVPAEGQQLSPHTHLALEAARIALRDKAQR